MWKNGAPAIAAPAALRQAAVVPAAQSAMESHVKEEIELQRLPMSDGSELVLTAYATRQHSDRGLFGTSMTTIPHASVSVVKIGWKRLEWLLTAGVILSAFCAIVAAALFAGSPDFLRSLGISDRGLKWALYALAALAAGALALFGFWKRAEIWIMAAGANIGGMPKTWDDALDFHDGLYSILRGADPEDYQAKAPEEPKKAPEEPKKEQPSESRWQL